MIYVWCMKTIYVYMSAETYKVLALALISANHIHHLALVSALTEGETKRIINQLIRLKDSYG